MAQSEPTISAQEWSSYQDRFVSADGRVIDDANGNISHSEGQGYGLLLAFLAGDQAAFARIVNFTTTELMVREDALLAWRWEPEQTPHIVDSNNATDGDILVAYALALAGYGWGRDDYLELGRNIANDVGREAVIRWRGHEIILPGAFGFEREDRADGPIVNLSYWVFEAFPVLSRLAPETDWTAIGQQGRRLIASSKLGAAQLPPDWISLASGSPRPGDGFSPEFGYNGIRIPLYLIRAGHTEPALLGHFHDWTRKQGGLATGLVESGRVIDMLEEPGYAAIAAALDCVLSNTPFPETLKTFSPTTYYASTLHLLTLSHLRQTANSCL